MRCGQEESDYIHRASLAGLLFVYLFAASAIASIIPDVWKELYKEVNNGVDPLWKGRDEAHAWALAEKELLEPIVVRIVHGEHPDISWRGVLFVARVIPTQAIRDSLMEPITDLVDQQGAQAVMGRSEDATTVSLALDVFAAGRDSRIVPIVSRLMNVEGQPQLVVEHCVLALRSVGDRNILAKLRSVRLRLRSEYIDRLCALAEKAIQMREQGQDIFSSAEQELREVNEAYIRAIENRDFEAYASVHPYGFRRGVDEEEFAREILRHSDMPDVIRALKEVAGREEFQIDRDNYQATLIVEGRYQFTYVLEVDGWKIHGPIRVGP